MSTTAALTDDWTGWIDDRWRGFPTGYAPLPIAQIAGRGWRPQDGRMALPLLSLDLTAFELNAEAVLRHLATESALIAPHAKTPMSVAIARRLQEAGAWGVTVADARQASVMLEGGLSRLILANQVGGAGGARRLAALLWHHPMAEVHTFVDSIEGVDALAAAWQVENSRGKGMPDLGLMIELGAGRAGMRDDQAAVRLMEHILALPAERGLRLAQVFQHGLVPPALLAGAQPLAELQSVTKPLGPQTKLVKFVQIQRRDVVASFQQPFMPPRELAGGVIRDGFIGRSCSLALFDPARQVGDEPPIALRPPRPFEAAVARGPCLVGGLIAGLRARAFFRS